MEYLTHADILARKESIEQSVERLLANRIFAGRPASRQWQFLRACLARLFTPGEIPDFAELPPVRSAQLKFEVEERLKRFYQRPGQADDYVFAIVHHKRAVELSLGEAYPQMSGYCLLVRELPPGENAQSQGLGKEFEEYLERFIGDAMQTEFTAYATLPTIRLEALAPYFWEDSPAMREILDSLYRCNQRGWVLTNPFNPSTYRLMTVRFKERKGGELFLASEEYWYLKWWDRQQERYTYVYRETNRQTYVLRGQGDTWKIYQNIRPLPRTSIPLRWKNRRK